MLRCIYAMHSKDFIHRDVRPENFRVKDDQIYIVDFASSKNISQEGKQFKPGSQPKALGTPLTCSIFAHQQIE